MQIIQCTDTTKDCKTPAEITTLLDLLLFKTFYVSDYLNYIRAVYNNTDEAPMNAKDNFHQKFSLKITDKVDSHNNLFLNKVDLLNERLYFWMPTKPFSFLLLAPIDVSTSKIIADLGGSGTPAPADDAE